MGEAGPVVLEQAVRQLSASEEPGAVEDALATISQASANLDVRPYLQDTSLFETLLHLYATVYAREPPSDLLRCVGNLVSDNGTTLLPNILNLRYRH